MKYLVFAISFFTIQAVWAQSESQNEMCNWPYTTIQIPASETNNGRNSNGIIFSHMTKLGNGFGELFGKSGLDFMTGKVVPWNGEGVGDANRLIGDLLLARPKEIDLPWFFTRKSWVINDTSYNDKDGSTSGIREVPVRGTNDGVECPIHENGNQDPYEFHYGERKPPRVGGLYCARARDGKSYALIQVIGVCKEGVIFNWIYQPNGRPNRINIFTPNANQYYPTSESTPSEGLQ